MRKSGQNLLTRKMNCQIMLVQEKIESQACNDSIGIDNDTDDEWCEATERPSGVMDTLLQEPDISQHGDKIISFAPGEGNRPLGLFVDQNSEHLSFPNYFLWKEKIR